MQTDFKQSCGVVASLVCLAILGASTFLCPIKLAAQDADQTRYLIIHTDDAGMSHSVNTGTVEALKTGTVTSASIMVPCPWFKEFAVFAKDNPQFDYGIHLTLTSEWDVYRWGPVAPRDKVPSLVDKEGYLWDNVPLVAENAKAEEVEIELKAQIDRALQFGVPLTHLDTHMGAMFSRPDLVEVYIRLGMQYNLPILFLKELDPAIAKEYPAMEPRFRECIQLLEAKRFPILDNVLQFYGGDVLEQREKLYYDQLAEIGPGVTELIIHCGVDNSELRGITGSSARRNQDRELFIDPKMKAFLDQQGIRLITWKEFRAMQSDSSTD